MINISPVWIISLLPEDNHSIFEQAVNIQFRAFTLRELNLENARWWGISHISGNDVANEFESRMPKVMKQAFPDNANDAAFIQNQLTVIVYAHSGEVESDRICELISDIKKKITPHINTIYYSLFTDKQENVKEPLVDFLFSQENPFDAVAIQDESNKHSGNANGYLNLYEGDDALEKKVYPLASQILLNMALGYSELNKKVISGSKVFATGSFSLVFENEVFKSQIAKYSLTMPILTHFFGTENSALWKSIHHTPKGLDTCLLELGAESMYNESVHVFTDEFEEIKHFYTHAVSPWDLLSQLLLPRYFFGENKLLLKRLFEYGRLMDIRLSSLFSKHLTGKVKELRDSLKNKLQAASVSLWSECSADIKTPIGIRQFIHNLDILKSKLLETKKLLETNGTEYSLISSKNEPIVPPQQIFEEYKKISTVYTVGTAQNDLSEAESEDGKEEINLLKLLKRKLEFHPIPLSLIVRAGILGIVLSVVSYSTLVSIPDFIFNTSYFEHGIGRIILFITMFFLPIAIALISYAVGTLGRIKLLKTKYLAWVFRRIQLRLIEETRSELSLLTQELINECETIEENLKKIMPQDIEKAKNEEDKINRIKEALDKHIVTKHYVYPINYFQQSVFDPIDQNSKLSYVTDTGQNNSSITLGNDIIQTSRIYDEEICYRIFVNYFITQEKYKSFFEFLKSGTNFNIFVQSVQNDFENYISTDKESIDSFEFTKNAKDIMSERSHPSGYKYTETFTEFAFSVIRQDSVNEQLKPLLEEQSDGSVNSLFVTCTAPDDLKLFGYRQLCRFYRLEKKEATRYSKK